MMNTKKLLIASCIFLSSCASDIDNAKKSVTIENLKAHTTALSTDECMGRKPFSAGADIAVKYIAEQMKSIGLKPVNGDSYLQDVKLVLSETEASEIMEINTPKNKMSLKLYENFTAFSKRIKENIDIKNASIVFAGYGIDAPEYKKNDYKDIENPQDKIALVFINDPGLGSDNTDYFNGDIMTYYGRWMYKFEEGARHGLKGVLIIHEDRGAGYNWSVVKASAKSKLYLDKQDDPNNCDLEGWIDYDSAAKLLSDNGYDIKELKEAAKSPDFKPFDIKSNLTVSMKNRFTYQTSPNVVGYIEGSKKNDESIVYTAHWDHLGYSAVPINGDSIINGTSDNATAIAWLLESARAFQSLKTKPERNIVFLSPTCEETGFWGTIHYVENPIFPIEKTVSVINLDVIPLWGENNDVTITGYGHSSLDEIVTEIAKKHNRYVMPDPEAYNGMFYRSDHFPFIKKGVPAMFAKGWNDNKANGKEWSQEKIKDYWTNTYHKPSDQTYPETDNYSGLLQEVHLFFDLGCYLDTMQGYPTWKQKSEFANVLKR